MTAEPPPVTVSTHVLDTAAGRPARGIAVRLSASSETTAGPVGDSVTGDNGRCADLPPLPPDATHATLTFATGPYLERAHGAPAFFPQATVTFAVTPGEHYHVPLLLNPYGYSVYRGS